MWYVFIFFCHWFQRYNLDNFRMTIIAEIASFLPQLSFFLSNVLFRWIYYLPCRIINLYFIGANPLSSQRMTIWLSSGQLNVSKTKQNKTNTSKELLGSVLKRRGGKKERKGGTFFFKRRGINVSLPLSLHLSPFLLPGTQIEWMEILQPFWNMRSRASSKV